MTRSPKNNHLLCLILGAMVFNGCTNASFVYPAHDVSIENMKQTVRYLSSLTPARQYANRGSMEAAARYIEQAFTSYGLAPGRQTYTVDGQAYCNVIASAGPARGERIIVGAHYDVYGDMPGADDNASAVAGLLETARFAKLHEADLPCRVDFVAYSLEEPPFFGTPNMGSYVHAKSLADDKINVRGMICLEMIGFFSNAKDSQRYPLSLMRLFYPTTGDFIGVVGNFGSASLAKLVAGHLRATKIKVETLKAPSSLTGVDFSDHRNYWAFGYDAVMVTDTAFYRNPNYHKLSDTIDTLDFNKMQAVVKGVCWSLLHLK